MLFVFLLPLMLVNKDYHSDHLQLTGRNTSNYSHDADKRLNFMSKRSVLCFSISLCSWNEKYDWHSL